MRRDFTYVDDIVEGVVRVMDRSAESDPGFNPAQPDPALSSAPYRLFNIGNQSPVELMAYVEAIEEALGKKAEKNFLPMQAGDVTATHADTTELARWVDFAPSTSIREGVKRFTQWYRKYYCV